ncbi:VOC family protein [Pontibacter sp. G13]|uniref:VOC family protein n=1 Tax=Pontibacter sp. G13 TaxID=3074898 RepID=UPI00288A58EA|nr:VOC family protein [Pontibacter sp. G13]WNJ17655.1 VOC family protein [Pontibacter sp. G13]
MPVPFQPTGYHTAVPYLMVEEMEAVMDFVVAAFDGEIHERLRDAGGMIFHAEVRVGDSIIMLGKASPEFGGMPGMIYLYVPDVQATYDRALALGAESVYPPARQFYGDVNGGIRDPFGHYWWISTHVEDVEPDELIRRASQRPSRT